MRRKWLAVGIILLFVGVTIAPAIAQDTRKQSSSRGDWLYVGGSGPGNYTKIQDAIDNAATGDTIFVYNGTYDEEIDIRKTIDLLGESKDATLIETESIDYTVEILKNSTSISGFTIRNTGDHTYPLIRLYTVNKVTVSDMILDGMNDLIGIQLHDADDNRIQQNFFLDCDRAISIFSKIPYHSFNNTIVDNCINGNGTGIELWSSDHTTISNNTFVVRQFGIAFYGGNHNLIENNTIYDANRPISLSSYGTNNTIAYNYIQNTDPSRKCKNGIYINQGRDTYVKGNIISNYIFGVLIKDSFIPVVEKNNFFHNIVHARFFNSICQWRGNYWGRPRILPKLIFGISNIERILPGFIQIDLHPAQEPYDIPGVI